jgi:hypothetical protein
MIGGREIDHALFVRTRHRAEILGKPHVLGVGLGLGKRDTPRRSEIYLVILVDKKVPLSELAPEDWLPRELEGMRVDVQEIGESRAL